MCVLVCREKGTSHLSTGNNAVPPHYNWGIDMGILQSLTRKKTCVDMRHSESEDEEWRANLFDVAVRVRVWDWQQGLVHHLLNCFALEKVPLDKP